MALTPVMEFTRNQVHTRGGAGVEIRSKRDLVSARKLGRALAAQLGFPTRDSILVSAAIHELACNILEYAKHGEIVVKPALTNGARGIQIEARDHGPGISNVAKAMQDGYSTSGRLGLGLPGVKRVMDEFTITSTVGHGTIVLVKKWNRGITH